MSDENDNKPENDPQLAAKIKGSARQIWLAVARPQLAQQPQADHQPGERDALRGANDPGTHLVRLAIGKGLDHILDPGIAMQAVRQQVLRAAGQRQDRPAPAGQRRNDRIDRAVSTQRDEGSDAGAIQLLCSRDRIAGKIRAVSNAQVRACAGIVQRLEQLLAHGAAAFVGDQPDIALFRHA